MAQRHKLKYLVLQEVHYDIDVRAGVLSTVVHDGLSSTLLRALHQLGAKDKAQDASYDLQHHNDEQQDNVLQDSNTGQ